MVCYLLAALVCFNLIIGGGQGPVSYILVCSDLCLLGVYCPTGFVVIEGAHGARMGAAGTDRITTHPDILPLARISYRLNKT